MNIVEFLKNFDNSISQFIDYSEKDYPHDVNFFLKYKTAKYIKDKKIVNDEDQKNYMLYKKKESDLIYCLGIDQELEYIQKLNYVLKIPISNKFHLCDAVLEGIELYDYLINNKTELLKKWHPNININIIQKLLDCGDNLDLFEQNLILIPFENNPIKKDIYVAQFIYFIKKYTEFRLNERNKKTSKVSKNDFNSALHYGLNVYLDSNEKSLFYQIVIKKLNLQS